MDQKIAQLTAFLQQNCLWQFASRTWDRQENLDGMFTTLELLFNKQPVPRETLAQRLYYADAKVLFQQLETRLPWFSSLTPAQASQAFQAAKAELSDIVITRSKNLEIHAAHY